MMSHVTLYAHVVHTVWHTWSPLLPNCPPCHYSSHVHILFIHSQTCPGPTDSCARKPTGPCELCSFSGLVTYPTHCMITYSWLGHTYHITLAGVDSICQTLDGNPLDWHLGNAPLAVVVPIVDLLGESEVCHTHGHVLIQPAQIEKKH